MGVEGFVTAIVDLFPNHLRRGYRKEMFIGLMCIIWFLFGLSMVTKVITSNIKFIKMHCNLYYNIGDDCLYIDFLKVLNSHQPIRT